MRMHRRGSDLVRSALAFAVVASLFAGVPIVFTPAVAAAAEPDANPHAHGEGEAAVSFAESWGCGVPATLKPFASKKGTLSASEAIRGPAGDFLGRDIGDVWGSLVEWQVPLSDGKVVKVHERALPAFELVTANLATAVENGLDYEVKSVGTYNPRTEPSDIKIDNAKAVRWLRNGAQPTERVVKLLKVSGAWEAFESGTSVEDLEAAASAAEEAAAQAAASPSDAPATAGAEA